jgi:hypothetical protein
MRMRLVRLARKFYESRDGAVAIQLGLMAVALIGFAALAVDVGSALALQRGMQSAADSAAISGAAAVAAGYSPAQYPAVYSNEVYASAATSGFVNGQNNVVVTPSTYQDASGNTYVKVVITKAQTVSLVGLVQSFYGSSGSDVFNIGVSAVARVAKTNHYCFLAISQTAPAAVYVGGSASLSSTNGCGIADNSDASNALQTKGSAASIQMPVSVVGGWQYTGNPPVPPLTWAWPVSDPYVANGENANLNHYPTGSCTNSKGPYTPGVHYCTLTGSQNLSAGTYYFDNLSLTGGATVTGSNVTLVFGPNATFQVTGNSALDITAPTSGPFASMAIASLSPNSLTILGTSNMTGAIYLPNGNVTFGGNSGSSCLQIIANTITFNGNTTVNDNCSQFQNSQIKGSTVQLIQ